ncbi:MAG: nitroreductase family protein [Clostridia bacterium]|nr:nitroreductase family protein [Clostridia bacterium]
MQATMSTLLQPAQKERMTAAVRVRTSCRAYAGDLAPAQTAQLAYHAGRYALPGARLRLVPLPENASTNITGCRAAVAVLVDGDSWLHRLNAGAIGEAFVLEATAMGLGTCWVGGSFRREAVRDVAAPGETLLALIAVGPPATPLTAPATRQRMAPEHLCQGNWRQWPEQLIRAATLVQQAPSGMNQQPWSLLIARGGGFAVDAPVHSALDAGIAILHAELALTTPHTWRFSDAPGAPLATAVADDRMI